MTAVEEAQAYLDKSSDLSALSDEEIIRNLPDEVLLQQLQEREQAARPGQPDNLNFTQALGLGLRDTGVAALHGVNAATGGFLKSAYEHPITPNPRLEAFGYTPSQEPRRFPEPITPEGKVMTAIDTGIGAFVGLPGKAFTKTAGAVAKYAPKIPAFIQRALAGGVGGAAFDVTQPETYGRNVALGAAGNVVLPPVINRLFQKKPPMMREDLLATPPGKVGKLPPAIRDLYIRDPRTQLAQQLQTERGELTTSTRAAKLELNRLDRETLSNLNTETERLQKQLQNQAYHVALKLKTTDIGPLLKQQSDRYADVARSAISKSEKISPLTPQEITQAIEKRFADNPKAFNLAYEKLKLNVLDEYGQVVNQFYSPQEVVNEIDRLGLGIQRSPTQAYTFEDHVADELRDTLLTIIEQKGVARGLDLTGIRQAKAEWAKWKPVQKRLLQGTRFFEQSETVTDAFVNKLMQYARTDRTMNNEKYFSEIEKYIGRDFAKPMRPIVAKMTAIERHQLAMEAAKLAELERIGIQTQAGRAQIARSATAGRASITNLEITLAEKAERAKRFWEILGKIGIIGGGVYGVSELRKLTR